MSRFFINFLMILGIIAVLNNNCFSQKNESDGFTKLALLKGKVVDKNGHGIPMIVILVYGTTLGGISQQDGLFELQVPENLLFGLLCWHPNYIKETFQVNNESKNYFTIILTESVNTIDFIKKEFYHSPDKIDNNLPKPTVKLEEEIIPDFFGFDEFPEYPGGENGFWQRYKNEIQILAETNRDKPNLKGIYHGTLLIGESGFMELLKVDEQMTKYQNNILKNFFLSFGQWKPVKWRGKLLEMEVKFVINFDLDLKNR